MIIPPASSNPPRNDAAHPKLPAVLTVEMTRLYNAGYFLIPLGGEDGKRPIMTFRDRKRFPLSAVVDRMGGSGRRTYGIRLKGLLVVDVDTNTPEAQAYVEENFGSSPGRTRTKRGFHLWFRYNGKKPKKIRLPGIAIDFKSGQNEMVVGPQSERPDGIIYWPEGRIPCIQDLPWFIDRRSPATPDAVDRHAPIPVGSRNEALKTRAILLARQANKFEDLLEV